MFESDGRDGKEIAGMMCVIMTLLILGCLLMAILSVMFLELMIAGITGYGNSTTTDYGNLIYISWLIWTGFAALFTTIGCACLLMAK